MTYAEQRELIKEAVNRGYRAGVLIDYEGIMAGTDTLGDGEFDFKEGKLIKYETNKGNDRRYDTIWTKDTGWTKIVIKKHGFSL